MKDLFLCAAQHWVFSLVVMMWMVAMIEVAGSYLYHSILVSMNALVKMQGWEDE